MRLPNVAHSISLRVAIDHTPGTLGRLTTAIGEAGGNILEIATVAASPEQLTREITILAVDSEHAERIQNAVYGLPGITVDAVHDRTFALHRGGKIEVVSRTPLTSRDDLSMAYTPGVARVCQAIAKDPAEAYRYTIKANTVAVVTDGTAVLGLGDIGPLAAMPVMEGKALLFKEFGGVDAFPICLDVKTEDELVQAVIQLAPTFGGINLEDIAAPMCFAVERRLEAALDIPIFHDDQHGTAVVALAALRNAAKVVGKDMADLGIVIAGMGAAGIAVTRILHNAGVTNIIGVDRKGALHAGRDDLNDEKRDVLSITNPEGRSGSLQDVLAGADVLIGVSGPGLATRDDILTMAKDPIVFALANPDPEVVPEEVADVTAVLATGRSDYANQINNVLCFPGIFRGALDAQATSITEEMKLAAATAIADAVPSDELGPGYIIPSVFDPTVGPRVAAAVAEAARAGGAVRS